MSTNTWDTTLTALLPDHRWKFDEAAGAYLDSGNTGGLDMAENIAGSNWRQAPGMVRGTPRVYGLWQNLAAGNSAFLASGPVAAAWTTGVFGAVVNVFSLAELGYPLTAGYLNNAGIWQGLRINLNGSVEFRIQQAGAIFNTGVSAAGAIVAGSSYVLVGVQRADGTGMRIYVNGVDATATNSFAGGGITLDSYAAAITNFAATDLDAGGLHGATEGGLIITEPFIFRNSVLSDPDITSLQTAANLAAAPDDYYEKVFEQAGADMRIWIPGWTAPGTLRAVGPNTGATETATPIGSGFATAPSQSNVQESGGLGAQIISDFNGIKNVYGTNNPVFFASGETQIGAADTIGTVNIVVTITSIPMGQTKHMVGYGDGAGLDNILFSLASGVFGIGIVMRIDRQTGDFWQGVSNNNRFAPFFTMYSFVQDGTGVVMYVDGVVEPFTPSQGGVSVDENDWFSAIAAVAVSNLQIGSLPGSPGVNNFQPNQLHDVQFIRRAYSATEISELWDAVNGIFPPAEPPGEWATTLEETGNAGQGPDWWWRMNAAAAPILDIGIAQNRVGPVPPPINADSIAVGGNPIFEVAGPLPDDVSNEAIYFDGLGDYFEIGVNAVAGQLVDVATGTIGFFFSRNSNDDANIVYSQGNDAYTAFWQFGMNKNRLELIVQTSAGNRVTLTGSKSFGSEFLEVVLTCDASKYRLYVGGAEDLGATVVAIGTGAEGDWFDAFVADQSAVGAMADNVFTTETTGRISELFIYDGDVLSATEIADLHEAAILDGSAGVPNVAGILVFENVTFLNGARADIRAEESTGTFQQVIKANRTRFFGGAQGSASYKPQTVLLKGPAQVQFRGCEADLDDTPAFGRGGIVGSAINPALASARNGSILVSDSDFKRMGYRNGSDFLAPVMCQAAFGMTVEASRFRDCHGSGVGWLADAQRVSVIDNQIEGTTQALAAIYSAQGLNPRLGSGWMIRGNKAIDTDGNAIDINGASSVATNFARNIQISKNETDNNLAGVAIRVHQVADALIQSNKANRCTEGVRLGQVQSSILVRRNEVDNHSLTAYIAAEGTLQLADVTFDRNKANGAAVGDGLTATNLRRLIIINNKLADMDLGYQIGEIALEGVFDGNAALTTGTPFSVLGGTTQNGFAVGQNQLEDLGNANTIAVAAASIDVIANYHTITAAAPINLDTIDGPLYDGFLLVLRRGAFSSDITLRDGIDNLAIGSDFLMDVDNDQIWLVRQGGNWNQVQRVQAL